MKISWKEKLDPNHWRKKERIQFGSLFKIENRLWGIKVKETRDHPGLCLLVYSSVIREYPFAVGSSQSFWSQKRFGPVYVLHPAKLPEPIPEIRFDTYFPLSRKYQRRLKVDDIMEQRYLGRLPDSEVQRIRGLLGQS